MREIANRAHSAVTISAGNTRPLPAIRPSSMEGMMMPESPLDNPDTAAFAWRRFKRLMWFMGLVTTVVVIAAGVYLYLENGMVSVHLYIAAALGIGFAMLLMSALMGLVFLSSGTGHDEAISDRVAKKD